MKKILLVFLMLSLLLLSACMSNKNKVLMELPPNEALKAGEAVIIMHALHRGSLMPTKWVKINSGEKFDINSPNNYKKEFTAYQSKKHGEFDPLYEYDLVVVPEGTYALYAAYVNCLDGKRPGFTGFDEKMLSEVSTNLGMVANVTKWNRSGRDVEYWGGFGWGWGGHKRSRVGGGVGIGTGGNMGPTGTPITSCSLYSEAVNSNNEILIAKLTVKSGEFVYAGELDYEIFPNADCKTRGNWMIDYYSATYCGAKKIDLSVNNKFYEYAKPYLTAVYGTQFADKFIIKLIEPGILVNK